MTLANIVPGAGPPPLPGIPYTLRGFISEGAPESYVWSATLTFAGKAIAKVAQHGVGQPITMAFPSDPERRRFEAFAGARAQRAGITDEEQMHKILLELANASYQYRRISKLASRSTVFQVRGDPDYYYLPAKPSPQVHEQLRSALGPHLDRIVSPSARRPRK